MVRTSLFSRLIPLLVCACASAQGPGRPTRAQEDAIIAENRKGAKPRPVTRSRGLTTIEQERARVFREARASVVYINASTSKVLNDYITGNVYAIPAGTGTGFVWDDLGHVVTNYHVIKMDVPGPDAVQPLDNIEVTLSDNRTYKARLIGRSLSDDIAVLHVFAPLKSMRPLPIGSSKDLVPGQSVLAIGNPFGLDHTLTSGIVSALDRVVFSGFNTPIKGVIQTDAAINPGNSGGPLLDLGGRLLGMNTAIPAVTGANIGIGFAIPIDTLNKVVPRLIASGQVERPSLGFTTLPSDLAFRDFNVEKGFAVYLVEPDSPAARAGMVGLIDQGQDKKPLLGDVIVGFQGKPVTTAVEMMDQISLLPPETPLVIDVLREGKTVTLTLKPTETAPEPKKATIPI